MSGKRDAQIRKFSEAIERGAIVYCSPAIYDAIQADSEYVAKFAGCEIRASKWCASDTLYAVLRAAPGFERGARADGAPSPETE